jgi:uncharacterized repeat protein (TIGR01451 family)
MKGNRNPPYNPLVSRVRLRRCFQRPQPRPSPSSDRRSHGQGLVELALILPVLLLLLLGIIEFSYVFAAYSGLFNAAREGARYGVVHPTDVSGIVSSTTGKILLGDPAAVDIGVAYDEGPGTAVFTDTGRVQIGDRVLVQLSYDLPTITPVIQPIAPTLPIRTQAARTVVSLGEGAWDPSSSGDGSTDGEDGDGDGEGAAIALSVGADPQTVQSGDAVLFTYTVTNTGDVDLTDVTVVDSFGNVITIGNLAAGATAVRSVSETITTTTTDEVTATGTDPQGGTVSDSDSVTVTVIGPALDLTVVASPRVVYSGEVVRFTYTVQNTGDTDLTNVSVVDGLGTSTAPADVAVGDSVFWQVSYYVYETTVNNVVATGTDPLGHPVSDSDSATVLVVEEMDPIVIHEPLYEGSTVVSGTAQAGRTIHIRDLQSDTFPGSADNSTPVLADGTFAFEGLPPLVAGHVIVVEAYGTWDSAIVLGDLDPIVINEPLCHGSSAIAGTAEPDQTVTLVVADTGYQDSTTIDTDGCFTFTLPDWQPLQAGQAVKVSGYAESASTAVQPCTTDAFIVISPQCGPSGSTIITVRGENWKYQSTNDDITIKWDGRNVDTFEADALPSQWETQITVDVTAGVHAVRAVNMKTPEVAATFLSPCPAPNLVINDLSLLTTEPVSTYQPLDFRATVQNVGDRPVNNLFWVDLYSSQPASQTTGVAWGAVSGLSVGDSTVLTVTLQSGLSTTGTFQIWALVDSWSQVAETDEEDNVGGPIMVTVSTEGTPPPTPPITTTVGSVEGETWVSLTGIPVPHGRANVQAIDTEGNVVASTVSDDEGRYEFSNLPVGNYTVLGETWIDGTRYSGTVADVEVVEDQATLAIVIMYRH